MDRWWGDERHGPRVQRSCWSEMQGLLTPVTPSHITEDLQYRRCRGSRRDGASKREQNPTNRHRGAAALPLAGTGTNWLVQAPRLACHLPHASPSATSSLLARLALFLVLLLLLAAAAAAGAGSTRRRCCRLLKSGCQTAQRGCFRTQATERRVLHATQTHAGAYATPLSHIHT